MEKNTQKLIEIAMNGKPLARRNLAGENLPLKVQKILTKDPNYLVREALSRNPHLAEECYLRMVLKKELWYQIGENPNCKGTKDYPVEFLLNYKKDYLEETLQQENSETTEIAAGLCREWAGSLKTLLETAKKLTDTNKNNKTNNKISIKDHLALKPPAETASEKEILTWIKNHAAEANLGLLTDVINKLSKSTRMKLFWLDPKIINVHFSLHGKIIKAIIGEDAYEKIAKPLKELK